MKLTQSITGRKALLSALTQIQVNQLLCFAVIKTDLSIS